MRKSERIFGWIYLPLHIFLLPLIVVPLVALKVTAQTGAPLDSEYYNLIYYAISFVLIMVFMFRFLRASFSDLFDNFLGSLKAIVFSYLLYYVAMLVISYLMSSIVDDPVNPNTEAAMSTVVSNFKVTAAISVILAPIVEEVLFRGVVFGTIRRKHRILAYAASAILFSVYHLWAYALIESDWTILVYLIQYIPGAIALAWCYERSGSIWASITVHAFINFLAIKVQSMM